MRIYLPAILLFAVYSCAPAHNTLIRTASKPIYVYPNDTTINGKRYWCQEYLPSDGQIDTIRWGRHYRKVVLPPVYVLDTIIDGKHYTTDTVNGSYRHYGYGYEYKYLTSEAR